MIENLFLYCNNCHNETSHRILTKHEYNSTVTFTYDDEEVDVVEWKYFVACNGCNHPSLYWTNDLLTDNPDSFSEAILCYPVIDTPPESLPDSLKKIYSEASLIFKHSPSAYAVQIRKAIEDICHQNNAEGKDLKEMIKDLVNKDILPGVFSKIADKIRYFGNIGAHAGKENLRKTDAGFLKDLFFTLVNYLYEAPEKLKNLEESIDKRYGKS